jgi:hypothetical protein
MPATAIASIVSPNINAAITAVDAGTRKKSRATLLRRHGATTNRRG